MCVDDFERKTAVIDSLQREAVTVVKVVTMAIYHDIIKRTATAAVSLVITLLHPAAVSPAFAPLKYGNTETTVWSVPDCCQCLALPPQH